MGRVNHLDPCPVLTVSADVGNAIVMGADGLPYLSLSVAPVLVRYSKSGEQPLIGFAVNVVDFDQVDYDPLGLVTPGAGWVFTVPVAGYYLVQGNVHLTQLAGQTGAPETVNNLFIYKNGQFYSTLDTYAIEPNGRGTAAQADVLHLSGSDMVRCAAGDLLDLRVLRGNSLLSIYGSVAQAWTHVAITRMLAD